ncbi:MAG: hypothetical protein QNJ23_03520 [Woeseiaceae bacterium]|nr:hypothetical protein [Woeseiaceae bacterium]
MTELERLANMAEILGALVVIGGLVFAMIQMRSLRQQRRELAAIELFRSFGNANFNRAYETILALPEGLPRAELVAREPTANSCATLICTTMENVGVMTYQRIVPFQVVHNLMGTSAVLLWRRLDKWVGELRDDLGNPEAFEWFQWLAEKLDEHNDPSSGPAYAAHKDWVPASLSSEI